MSTHFAVLREAELICSEKQGKSIVYQLQMSVLEDALLRFARTFGWKLQTSENSQKVPFGRS